MLTRREFIKNIGLTGTGVLLASTPWLSAFSEQKFTTGEKARIGIIGPGSRGQYLMSFLLSNQKAEIVAICDIYQPSIDAALQMAPKARVYRDHRDLLADKEVDGVFITTPLNTHFQIAMDAFDAGKHIYCEKSIGYTMDECLGMYDRHIETGQVFFGGQQRLYDPRYIKAMEMVHSGMFGDIEAVRTYWFRNGDWRRGVPSPELERLINWRLYREYSRGLMTELACHQLQIGSWARQKFPEKVMGHGAITHWKDGREVYDNINCIYVFDDGVKMTFESVISNKFNGLEEQLLGSKGTVFPEKGTYYFEEVAPDPGFMQMLTDIQNKLFDTLPTAGTSWAPETSRETKGEFITGNRPKGDGTDLIVNAFVESVITGKQPVGIAEECYYASIMALWGDDALLRGEMLPFPEEYKIDYLNHRRTRKEEEI